MGKRDKCVDGVEVVKKEQKEQGIRGPRGPIGPTGPAASNLPNFADAIAMGPTLKAEAATFYGEGPGTVGVGDIFDFPLDGANDPITRLDSGTFVLPTAGLYKVFWQIPIVQGATGPTGPNSSPFIQSTLTAQTVEEGSFVPVAGGVVGRGAPLAQLVGETIIEATRDGFPIRIENTSTVPVDYYSGNPANGNQRTINIQNLVPRRIDAIGTLLNVSAQLVPANADINFDTQGEFVNVEFVPTFAFEIQVAGCYIIQWSVKGISVPPGEIIYFAPFKNGVAMPLWPIGSPSNTFRFNESYGTYLSYDVLQPGDIITLRNVTGSPDITSAPGTQPVQLTPPAPAPPPPPPPPPGSVGATGPTGPSGDESFYNALFQIQLSSVCRTV